MPEESLQFPKPLPGDAPGVVAALQIGGTEWNRGELRAAVRWIHRAADAAETAGNDVRALGLARTAADLMSSLDIARSAPERDEGAALAPFDDFNDQTLVDAPALLAVRQALQSSVVLEARTPRTLDPLLDTVVSAERGPEPIRRRTAVRVAVGQVASGDGSLRVRVLADGVSAPEGTIEALLVVLDPNAQLPLRLER